MLQDPVGFAVANQIVAKNAEDPLYINLILRQNHLVQYIEDTGLVAQFSKELNGHTDFGIKSFAQHSVEHTAIQELKDAYQNFKMELINFYFAKNLDKAAEIMSEINKPDTGCLDLLLLAIEKCKIAVVGPKPVQFLDREKYAKFDKMVADAYDAVTKDAQQPTPLASHRQPRV